MFQNNFENVFLVLNLEFRYNSVSVTQVLPQKMRKSTGLSSIVL